MKKIWRIDVEIEEEGELWRMEKEEEEEEEKVLVCYIVLQTWKLTKMFQK